MPRRVRVASAVNARQTNANFDNVANCELVVVVFVYFPKRYAIYIRQISPHNSGIGSHVCVCVRLALTFIYLRHDSIVEM